MRYMQAPDVTKIVDGIEAASAALTLTNRIRAILTPDPVRRAARLRGRAARLLARAETAHRPAQAARLRAKAAGLLAEAEALEAACQ